MWNLEYVKKQTSCFTLNYEEIKEYEEVAIFVQKRNDLDTCCCAAALANIIKDHFENINVSIFGIRNTSKFLKKNIHKFRDKPIDWSKKVLVILSEICSLEEVTKEQLELIKKGNKIWLIDHHDSKNTLIKEIEKKQVKVFNDKDQTSACEVLLQMIRNWNKYEEKWKPSEEVVKIIFSGIYFDCSEFLSAEPSTYENISYLCQKYNFWPKETLLKLHSRPITHLKLFAEVVEKAEFEKNLVYLSLKPEMVWKHLPNHMTMQEKGKLKRKKMLTWIPRMVERLCDSNTIIFCHYSLYEPYNREKKYVYVVLKKDNPGLESVLHAENFKQSKHTWSRTMSLDDLSCLIEKYKALFIA